MGFGDFVEDTANAVGDGDATAWRFWVGLLILFFGFCLFVGTLRGCYLCTASRKRRARKKAMNDDFDVEALAGGDTTAVELPGAAYQAPPYPPSAYQAPQYYAPSFQAPSDAHVQVHNVYPVEKAPTIKVPPAYLAAEPHPSHAYPSPHSSLPPSEPAVVAVPLAHQTSLPPERRASGRYQPPPYAAYEDAAPRRSRAPEILPAHAAADETYASSHAPPSRYILPYNEAIPDTRASRSLRTSHSAPRGAWRGDADTAQPPLVPSPRTPSAGGDGASLAEPAAATPRTPERSPRRANPPAYLTSLGIPRSLLEAQSQGLSVSQGFQLEGEVVGVDSRALVREASSPGDMDVAESTVPSGSLSQTAGESGLPTLAPPVTILQHLGLMALREVTPSHTAAQRDLPAASLARLRDIGVRFWQLHRRDPGHYHIVRRIHNLSPPFHKDIIDVEPNAGTPRHSLLGEAITPFSQEVVYVDVAPEGAVWIEVLGDHAELRWIDVALREGAVVVLPPGAFYRLRVADDALVGLVRGSMM